MGSCNIAVIGATGVVGQVFLNILEQRNFPASKIRLCASHRSAGKRIKVFGEELVVEETTMDSFREADISFISASSEISLEFAPLATRQGSIVIDDSSAFRMQSEVPLVVPEINAADLEGHQGIISIPNCSTTQMVMALYPLHRANPIQRVIVDTYQSVSGTGRAAIEELRVQSQASLDGRHSPPKAYPHPIAFNILPHIEPFMDNGYTKEEWKMLEETRKIMHSPELNISATCVRVPVYFCHSEALHVEFTHPMLPQEAREVLAAFPGVKVLDDPKGNSYPLPNQVTGTDEVVVGRIRQDASHPNSLAMWVVADNIRKGAALNAIQIAEEILNRGLLLRA